MGHARWRRQVTQSQRFCKQALHQINVIGHSTVLPGRIVSRLDGRVILIDTGMVNGEFYPGGVSSALEWNGTMVTAIYLDRREPLVAPALQSAAPAASR